MTKDKAQRPTLAIVAHDQMKDRMRDWAVAHEQHLGRYRLFATGTTGSIVGAACPGLKIKRLKSGPLGGDQQIGAMTALPHDVDVKALIRLSILYDIPFACNEATADLLIRGMAGSRRPSRQR